MPYLIDKDTKITDTLSIMVYLCNAYEPDLLGASPADKARIDILANHMKEVKSSITGPCYTGTDPQILAETAKQKMVPLINALGKKDYMMGETITYIDFLMLELLDFMQFLTTNAFLEQKENKPLIKYVKRIKGIKQIKKYLASDRFLEKPFNNKIAKINNL